MKNKNPRRPFRNAIAFGVVFLALGAPSLSLGWGPGGHMITAQIAFDRLNPRAKAQAKMLLAIPINPAATSAKSKDFVNAAHWADDLRSIPAFKSFEPLHFIDKRFSTDGTPLPAIPRAQHRDRSSGKCKNTQDEHRPERAGSGVAADYSFRGRYPSAIALLRQS